MVETARKALPVVQAAGLDATIINARSLKPLDATMLKTLIEDSDIQIITLEEGAVSGGFGSAILEFAAQHRLQNPRAQQAQILPLGVPDQFIEHGGRSILLDQVGLSTDKVAETILQLWQS
jgi:1-deoxy-D-xylulose-5-phosphate synthase